MRLLPFRSVLTIFPLLLLSSFAAGCAEDEPPTAAACTFEDLKACPPLSVAVRSTPWPESRVGLAKLAEVTERMSAEDPRRLVISHVRSNPEPLPLYMAWPGAVSQRDRDSRYSVIRDADDKHWAFLSALDDVVYESSPTNVRAAAARALQVKDAYVRLRQEDMFVDPFGQPEPRTALFVFARAATVVQLLSPASARRAVATDAAAVLEKRIEQWASMQRELLAGKPAAEIDRAIESIGVAEIRRLVAAWQRLDSPAIRALLD